MALTVHVDIVKRTELAISKDLLVTKIWLILQLKKKEKEKKRENKQHSSKDTEYNV